MEQRSARLPVTQEIVGSNPIGDADGSRAESRESRAGTHKSGSRLLTLDSRLTQHGTQTWKSGEAQTFVTMWVRLPPVLLQLGLCSSWLPVKQSSQNKRGGRREVQFLHDPLKMARSSNGRMRDPHSRDAGSIPARVTDYSQVVELGYTRRSERRALCGMGVRISPWLFRRENAEGGTGNVMLVPSPSPLPLSPL